MAQGVHPFPFRTRPLSPAAPMVLPLRGGGRVGRRPILRSPRLRTGAFFVHSQRRGDVMRSPAQTVDGRFCVDGCGYSLLPPSQLALERMTSSRLSCAKVSCEGRACRFVLLEVLSAIEMIARLSSCKVWSFTPPRATPGTFLSSDSSLLVAPLWLIPGSARCRLIHFGWN